MIIYKKIRYKNFLSSGNIFNEIDLNNYKNTLIVGNNGAGKSTTFEALVYVLYNKPYRKIVKSLLINTYTKKNLLVELEFSSDGNEYIIKRGMKPNIFEIYKNGELLNQEADSKDYQHILEKQIIRKGFKTFCQVDVLGSAKYIAFMELPSPQKREIIEDLLDLQIFSSMNIICKEKISNLNKEMFDIKSNIKVLNAKLETFSISKKHTSNFIESQINEYEMKKDKLIIEYKNQVSDYNILIKQYENKKIDDTSTLKNNIFDINKKISKLESNIEYNSKNINFLNNHKNCPTCKQNITLSFKDSTILELSNENSKIDNYITKGKLKLENLTKEYNDLNDKNEEIKKEFYKIEQNKNLIENIKKTILEYKKEIEKLQSKLLETKIDTIQDEELISVQINNNENQYNDLYKQHSDLLEIQNSLKDEGIKSQIIAEYIPYLNERINYYLQSMNFMISFELSETFEEKILSNFRNTFSYFSLSEGQKYRINLAILFAFRDIAKKRSTNLSNLIFLDEILDSSMDSDGIDDFFSILETLPERNIFIISHNPDEITEKFDRVLKFSLKQNFTVMEEI